MDGNLPHTGDVHSPEEFGFDSTDPTDRKKWMEEISGQLPMVRLDVVPDDFTEIDHEMVAYLLDTGVPIELAVQTVHYDRLERA